VGTWEGEGVEIGVKYSSSVRLSVGKWEGEVGGNRCKIFLVRPSVCPFVGDWESEVGRNMCKILLVRPFVAIGKERGWK